MENKLRDEIFSGYISDVKAAKSEQPKKELFLNLLGSPAFFGENASDFVKQFAAGAENNIYNIARKGKRSELGFADTQYGTVIIEFEDDLKKTGAHAADQLKDYLSGNWNSGIQARFTLIATDCLVWMIYSPNYDTLVELEHLKADDIVFNAPIIFDVREHTADEFYFFINRYLMVYDAKPATIDEIKLTFGHGGEVYNAAMSGLNKVYRKIKDTSEMRTAFEQWEKLLSIAYGRFQGSDELFLTHSYLSALAKIMAYVVISGGEFIDDAALKGIITGDAFRSYHVANFTDEDFFRWIALHIDDKMMISVLRDIASGLYDFNMKSITDDILKGVYQELVDNDMKHSLGEHYTPDWLCASVVREIAPLRGERVLDPSCGSGSFLKATANYLIDRYPDITAHELNDQLYGIDVHPLSVQIAKATVLIAIGERMYDAKRSISINVFLANTLLLPEKGVNKLLTAGLSRTVNIDNESVDINQDIFKDRTSFAGVIETCSKLSDEDAKIGKIKRYVDLEVFLKKHFKRNDREFLSSVHSLYEALTKTKIDGRDGIWAFILNNIYIPFFLKNSIDLVIGNPPWLTFKDIENGEYQTDVKIVASKYYAHQKQDHLKTQLELASVFLAHCVNYFLKKSGRLAFVLPRSFFSAGQHENLRRGELLNVRVTAAWDLDDVSPLFNVPSCVIFADRRERHYDEQGYLIPVIDEVCSFPGERFTGRLKDHNADIDTADKVIKKKTAEVCLSQLGGNTAWTLGYKIALSGENAYKDHFRQGATIVPQKCFYVDFAYERYKDRNLADRELEVWSCETLQAKRPWDVKLRGMMHTRFMFETALANNIVPFALNGTHFVVLPTDDPAEFGGRIRLMMPDELMNATGEMTGIDWFKKVVEIWEKNKTDNNKSTSIIDYLDYMHKLSEQKLDERYVVMYSGRGSNANALVIDRNGSTSFPIISTNNAYAYFTNDKAEAMYLIAFLNSVIVNDLMKPFQSTGLLGERNIHKKILDVPLPRYDENDPDHMALAELAEAASIKAAAFVRAQGHDHKGNSLRPNELGKFRNNVRDHLKKEMAEIDSILARVIGVDLP